MSKREFVYTDYGPVEKPRVVDLSQVYVPDLDGEPPKEEETEETKKEEKAKPKEAKKARKQEPPKEKVDQSFRDAFNVISSLQVELNKDSLRLEEERPREVDHLPPYKPKEGGIDGNKEYDIIFDWCQYGKPDKAMVAEIVETLPESIRAQLSRPATEVLKLFIFLWWVNAYENKQTGLGYCYPSRQYIGAVCRRSESTVKRILDKLESLDLISRRQGRRDNRYWVNIYTPASRLIGHFFGLIKTTGHLVKGVTRGISMATKFDIEKFAKHLWQCFSGSFRSSSASARKKIKKKIEKRISKIRKNLSELASETDLTGGFRGLTVIPST